MPFPINICPAVKDVEPVPPKETGKVPAVTFDAFNALFKAYADKSILILFVCFARLIYHLFYFQVMKNLSY